MSTGTGDPFSVVLTFAEFDGADCKSVELVTPALEVSELPDSGTIGVSVAVTVLEFTGIAITGAVPLDLPEPGFTESVGTDAVPLALELSELTGKRVVALTGVTSKGSDLIGTGMIDFGVPDLVVVAEADAD